MSIRSFLRHVLVIAGILTISAVVARGTPQENGKNSPAKNSPAKNAQSPATGKTQGPSVSKEAGLSAFAVVAQVTLSPRCRNCHAADDRPRQRDEGIVHRMSISRRSTEVGLQCTACHRETNAKQAGAPPGAEDWRMPPREIPMVFMGKTPQQICMQLGDPEQTNGRALHDLVDHVLEDPLVKWSWQPGPGRTPPPVPYEEFVEALRVWTQAGGPCPAE